ncbi:MAG: Ig-like domain-containing protein [Candidatus Cloacimonetes bacterium]|nr:Ig-like domain-containing protein [Candidatus Cloacimonadota bacterium]MBL7086371.1 Ig-like domain-containing protein [Candidatus Cloacimonadota bacterium]
MKYILSIIIVCFLIVGNLYSIQDIAFDKNYNLFTSLRDTEPPYVDNLNPDSNATNVPVDTDITFHIYDDEDGVDLDSIKVEIQDVLYTSTNSCFYYSGTDSNYSIVINPPLDFSFGDTVYVKIRASDNSIPPNIMPEVLYFFECIEDSLPPYIGELDPSPDSLDIPVNTNITFHIFDNGVGVDLASILIDIQDIQYSVSDEYFYVSGTANDYEILIDIPYEFEIGEVVNVQIDAADLNEIQMDTFVFWFQCEYDTQPPTSGEFNPSQGATDVPIDTNISFNIYDNMAGVDTTSVVVKIQDVPYNYLNSTFDIDDIANGYTITIDPINNFDYEEIVSVQIDAEDLAEPPNIMQAVSYSFQCLILNTPPVVENIEIITLEDTPVNIILYAYDAEGDDLIFNVIDETIHGVFDDGIYTPNVNYNGVDSFTYNAFDGELYSNTATVTITITSVNDKPTIVLPNSFTFEEDSTLIVNFEPYINDVEDEPLTLTVSDNYYIIVTIDTFEVTLGAIENWNGSETITFIVTDSCMESGSDEIEIVVNDVNDVPTIVLPDSFTFKEDSTLIVDFEPYINDIDNDPLTLTVSDNIINITADIDGYIVIFGAVDDWSGSEILLFTVNDNQGRTIASDSVDIIVTPVNDPPIFNIDLLPDYFSFEEDSSIEIDFAQYVSDPEQSLGELTLFVTGNTDINVEVSDMIVNLSAPQNWIGSEIMTFTLEDNQSRAATSVDIKIIVNPETPEEKIKVEPHTITWGKNSCNIIIYSQEANEKIKCKILNRNGELITNLDVEDFGKNKKATWNAKRANGSNVSGGFYIYQVVINGRVYQGSVIVVR